MLERLVYIQAKTQLPISFPPRSVEHEEMKRIFEVAAILNNGQMIADNLSIDVDRELGEILLECFASNAPLCQGCREIWMKS